MDSIALFIGQRLGLDSPSKIIPNLSIGSIGSLDCIDSNLYDVLINFSGTLIVCTNTKVYGIKKFIRTSKVNEIYNIPMPDSPDLQLSAYSHELLKIDEYLAQKKRVLIICKAGKSRSASICILYLMRYRNLNFQSAYDLVKKSRPAIHPNYGFMKQLINHPTIRSFHHHV